ncbi:MAG: DUF3465 domain-containing protein [Planctomycetota bacterium]|nr:MAG: DUF3465 domain-containing protein [Planctomycetota bacterium]
MTIVADTRSQMRGQLFFLAVALVLGAIMYFTSDRESPGTDTDVALLDAIESHATHAWVETDATVVKILADDQEGDRHQRFLVDVEGKSLLVAHNIDIAARAPVIPGETIRLRGQYEWNEEGGVLHWTHRALRQTGPDGWLRVRGVTYW